MSESLTMTISGIVPKDGRKHIYVTFEDGKCKAEGYIPDCVITSSTGFSNDEIKMLELYMKHSQDEIREHAKKINPIKALMQ